MTLGGVARANLHLIRPNSEVLDPWFLAGYLRSENAARYWSSLSGTHRINALQVEVPLLPIAVQRVYADAFRRLREFEQALTAVGELGQQLAATLRGGLATGTV